MSLQITTPVGRIVQGHPFEYTDKDMQGNPLRDQQGNPRVKYFLALAVDKNDPGWPQLWGELCKAAQTGFPNGEYNRQDFAWKVVDGDAPDKIGKEGFAGHWILKMSNGYAPRVYTQHGEQQIVDKTQIKRGDYVRVALTVAGNEQSAKPGLYLNHNMVELIGYGQEIQTGPDPRAAFADAPAHVPPGASATPTASGPPMATPGASAAPSAPGTPGAGPMPPAGPGGSPAPAQAPPAAGPGQPAAPGQPGAPAAPAAPGGANPPGPGQPPAGPATAAPAAPGAPATPAPAPATPQYQMTEKAAGWTYQQFSDAGWSDQQLLENGYMVTSNGSVTPAPDFLNPGQPR